MLWWERLGEICRERPLERKHLLVPTRRVGRQVLERLARSGTGTVNVLPSDLRGFLLGTLCSGFADLMGREYAPRRLLQLVTLHCLGKAAEEGRCRYFSRARPGPGLIRYLVGILQEIRMAEVLDPGIRERLYLLGERVESLADLLREYEDALERLNLVDFPGVVAVCLNRAAQAPGELEEFLQNDLLLVPAFYWESWTRAEKELWSRFPAERKMVLVDHPGEGPGNGEGGFPTLWDPAGDDGGSKGGRPLGIPPIRAEWVEIRGAVGEANEIRGVFRKILEEGIPLDQVEIVYTDDSTYRPLLVDLSRTFVVPKAEEGGLIDPRGDDEEGTRGEGDRFPEERSASQGELPISFTRGIPICMTRPGRALLVWLDWLDSDNDPRILAKPVGEGLFRLEKIENSAAAALLFCLPLGGAPCPDLPIYLENLATMVESDQNGKTFPLFLEHWMIRWGREKLSFCLRELSSLARDLQIQSGDGAGAGLVGREGLDALPHREPPSDHLLSGALKLLRERAAVKEKLDAYARDLLEEELGRALQWAERLGWGISSRCFLENLLREPSVLGEGPRPGRLYATPLEEGGFSGRPYLFILGLDSSRFPRRPPADPVLSEEERAFLSSLSLPYPGKDLLRLAEILQEKRKGVFLSFSRYDLKREEESYPSPSILNLLPGLNGPPSERGLHTLEDLYRHLDRDATYAPEEPSMAATEAEWWASAGRKWGTGSARKASFLRFPHLKRGHEAWNWRSREDFTEYDGWVPEAGAHLDPFDTESGMVLSAEKLSKMGKNPFDFFLEEVLKLKRPPFHQPGAFTWLDPIEEGSLLHRVFQSITEALVETGRENLSLEWSMGRAREILDEELSWWERIKPPPNQSTRWRKRDEYLRMVHTFVEHCLLLLRGGRVIVPEIAYGIPGKSNERAALDEPVTVELADGQRLRLRGVVDALEMDLSSGLCRVWDYKTGSSASFRRDDPFQGGRTCQPIVYPLLVEEGGLGGQLAGPVGRVTVKEFLFFFLGLNDLGETLSWERKEVERGKSVLRDLAELIRLGAFPVSPNEEDLDFSPYREVHEDLLGAVRKTAKLMEGDERLAPLRRLRNG